MGADYTVEEIIELSQNWDRLAEAFRTINGAEFSLEDRPYLRPIYREFKPNTPKTVILMCSRKVEKTETGVNLFILPLLLIPYWRAVYTIARSVQVNVFSTERLATALGTSVDGILSKKLKKPTNVHHKQFHIDPNDRYFNHGYLYSAWGEGASLLGLACDYVHVDEAQDMPGEWLPKIMEIISLSRHKHMLISGTARDKGDNFDQTWEMSDKREWFVKCESCGREQMLDFRNILGKPGHKYKGCRFCEVELDVRIGKWRPTKDPNTSYYVGYHMNQLMHPQITANEIQIKWEKYESERLFYNEVLGVPYAGGLRPVTIDQVLSKTNKEIGIIYPNEYVSDAKTYLGMDCGLGHHICVIDENKRILFQRVSKLSDYKSFDDQMLGISNIIRGFGCSNVVIDWGYGPNEVQSLQRIHGELVKGCEYKLNDPDDPIQYKPYNDAGDPIFRLHVDRSATLDKVFHNFKFPPGWQIPYDESSRSVVEEFFDHYTNFISNLPEKMEKRGDIKQKEKPTMYGSTGPDHMGHALNYAYIGMLSEDETSVSMSSII